MDAVAVPLPGATRHVVVGGMTCGACARHVETALGRLPGVRAVHVDFAAGLAVIETEERAASFEAMRRAVTDAGYTLEEGPAVAVGRHLPVQPVLWGAVAAAGLLLFYLGLITLAQGWAHALEQLSEDRWFVGAIAAGFGTQIGLFTYLRGLHARATAGGVAASTGTSAAAMLACCAHHVTDILPIIGLSGAAVFLNVYKTPLLWLGIGMNLAGIGYMLWQIRRQRALVCATPGRTVDAPGRTPVAPRSPSAGCH